MIVFFLSNEREQDNTTHTSNQRFGHLLKSWLSMCALVSSFVLSQGALFMDISGVYWLSLGAYMRTERISYTGT